MSHEDADERTPGLDLGLPTSILRLVGDDVHVLHPLASTSSNVGGGDIDCAVSGVDPAWPLRLPPGFRLVQYLHYDVRAWAWVLEHNGRFTMVDVIDDPAGINRLGVTTTLFEGGSAILADPSARAAYLVAKRVWKGQLDVEHWKQISELQAAAVDGRFGRGLHRTFGKNVATRLEATVRSGGVIDRRLWVFARATQFIKRFDSPTKAASLLVRMPIRVVERLLRPTGIFLVILGQRDDDRSSVRDHVVEGLRGPLMRERTIHWSDLQGPGPSDLITSPSSVWTYRGWLRSSVRAFPAIWWHRVAKGLIIVEGGWQQIRTPQEGSHLTRAVATMFASIVPQPDLTLLIARGSDSEESGGGVEGADRTEHEGPTSLLVASTPRDLAWKGRSLALERLASRARQRIGTGWTALPLPGSSVTVPRGPRASAASALAIHQPSADDHASWTLMQGLARGGLLRLLPRSTSPPESVRIRLAGHLSPRSTFSVARTSQANRFIAALIGANGSVYGVAKIATDVTGSERIEREAALLERLGVLALDPILKTPKVIDYSPGVLILEPIVWRRSTTPWKVPEDVAHALGLLNGYRIASDGTRLLHGNLTHRELRASRDGWVLLDWEDAVETQDPGLALHDLFHHFLTAHASLGRPTAGEIREGLRRTGWVGRIIDAYLRGAELDADDLHRTFEAFLLRGDRDVSPESGMARRARQRLLAMLGH